MKIMLSTLLAAFMTTSTVIASNDLTEEAIAGIKEGAGNFLTCSVAIRSSFSLVDTIPDAKDENGNPVEIRLHDLAERIFIEAKRVFATVGVKESVVEDIAAAKRTQWLYLNEHEKADIMQACAKALSGDE